MEPLLSDVAAYPQATDNKTGDAIVEDPLKRINALKTSV